MGEVKFGMSEYVVRPRENSIGAMSSVSATPTSPGVGGKFEFERARRGSRVSRTGPP